jgi:enoyl-CoA hydratase/carnithine racemase
MGVVDLAEALDLVSLVAEVAPDRLEGYARRWLSRLADEQPLALAELDLAVTALRALPSPRAGDALRALL